MAQRRLATIASLVVLGLIAGCGGGRGVPLTPPVIPVGDFTIKDGSALQQARLGEAVKRVQSIWEDERFWDFVKARSWLPGPFDAPISGEDVVKALHSSRPGSQYYTIALWVRHAVAKTASCGKITIGAKHVTADSYLINTVAHENTHIVGRGAGDVGCGEGDWASYRFTDSGHTDATRPWLVSYALGDLAQCFSEHDGEREAMTVCFEHRVNGGSHACRQWEECCNGTSGNVGQVQKMSGRCSHACTESREKFCSTAEDTEEDEFMTVK